MHKQFLEGNTQKHQLPLLRIRPREVQGDGRELFNVLFVFFLNCFSFPTINVKCDQVKKKSIWNIT